MPCSKFNDRDASFEVPVCVADICYVLAGKVLPEERAHAVNLAAETAGVVFVAGEIHVECVSCVGSENIVFSKARIDEVQESIWGLLVGRADLYFLEEQDFWPAMSLQELSKGISNIGRSGISALLDWRFIGTFWPFAIDWPEERCD